MDSPGTGKKRIALMSYAMDNRSAKGTALYTRKLIERLLEDDSFEWYLVHFDRVDDPLYKKAREIIMPEIRLPFATRFVRTLLFFWKYRKEKFDIIHWFQPRLYPFFWLAPARKIVVTAHAAGDITAPQRFVFSRSMFNFVLIHFHSYVDAVIAVSQYAKEEIITHYRMPREKVYAIYNGGGEEFKPMERTVAAEKMRTGYGVSTPYLLAVGRFIPHKNNERIVQAFDRALQGKSMPHTLVLVASGPDQARVKEVIAKTHMPEKINIIPYVAHEDMNAMYAAADALLFPSLNEGFGLPIVEAFSSGTPVITSNTTCLPEIAGDAAITVNPESVEEIARAITEVVTDEEKRRMLSAAGLLRAREFTWDTMTAQTISLYRTFLNI